MTPPLSDSPPSDTPGCISYLIFAAVAAWVLAASVGVHLIAWFAWLALARAYPRTWDQAAALTQVLLAGSAMLVLLWALRARWPAPATRPFGLIWALILVPLVTF